MFSDIGAYIHINFRWTSKLLVITSAAQLLCGASCSSSFASSKRVSACSAKEDLHGEEGERGEEREGKGRVGRETVKRSKNPFQLLA